MATMKKVLVGGLAAGAVALGLAIVGPAHADPTTVTTTPAPAPGWSTDEIHKAICDNSYWRNKFVNDCLNLGL